MKQLEGRAALVLGAASAGNIGQTIARRLGAEGAHVVVAGRHREPLSELQFIGPMAAFFFEDTELVERAKANLPLGRFGAAVWLSTDGCFTTGQLLQVNGGTTLVGGGG